MSFDFTSNLSTLIYDWVLDQTAGTPPGSEYTPIFFNHPNPEIGHGMEYGFFFLLGVSLLSVLAFYFVISSDITRATWKNYFATLGIGYVVLVAANIFGIGAILNLDVWCNNMLKLCVVDILYYLLLFEAFSWCFKSMSKASRISMVDFFINR